MERKDIFIEAEELLSKLGDPNLRIYDAKIEFYLGMSPEEAAKMPGARKQYQAGHIPGAAFFDHQVFSDPLSEYEYMMTTDTMLTRGIGKMGISNDSEVVVYAPHLIPNATRAWWILRYAGVQNVRIMDGGLAAWQAAGGELETGENKYEPAEFTPTFNKAMWASMQDVQAAGEKLEVEVQDALPQDWHDQEHIPGSTCVPLLNFEAGLESFPSQDELDAQLPEAKPGKQIITYCGGGIAATVNAVAYLVSGHDNVAVYDGSLFEWKGEGQPLGSNAGE
ncbi:MAG: sulfurtransferase [Chloroflexi bacterium]|nr:MAG: sulfurtransferase [Chloroflexota bacterium]MBL1194895.1 sulfurtransferase [Chloroflexota bacterium]NOH12186.1 sulfurtransferase [Chloroflexota bacterium]